MAFVVGGLLIGAGAAVGGAALSAKGSRDAADTAKAGSDAQIAYNRESRDIGLNLGAPYREAGYSALDKLGAMTGLVEPGGSFGRPDPMGGSAVTSQGTPWGDSPWTLGFEDGQYTATLGDQKNYWDDASQQWMTSRGSAYGSKEDFVGRISRGFAGRAYGGVLYNVNELGPESIYSRGSYTRTDMPKTMPEDKRGYVHAGRAYGGVMIDPNSMGDNVSGYKPVNKGGEFGWRDGIPSNKRNMSNDTIDMTADVFNRGTNNGAIYDEGGVPIPQENPYDFTTDPGYNFRFNEGMRALESSAAARGGLLSGGFGRKAIRYGQDYASNEFSNIYNRISNIAGLGQVNVGQGGVFAQNAGAQMGAAAGQGALSSAYGKMAGTNAWANAANQIAQLPWGDVFGKK